MGNFRAISPSMMVRPTNPVAPTTAKVLPCVDAMVCFFAVRQRPQSLCGRRIPLLQRYEFGGMQTHRWILWSMAALASASVGLPMMPIQAQESPSNGWVISAIHPDPTPALGAPEAEYIALHALSDGPSGPDAFSTGGLVLSWNGHNRELPQGEWAAGSTVVVHRAADSLHFEGWAQQRIGLTSWPALVNGGALVSLSDSSGAMLDAVLYDEEALSGGGRPLLRKDPWACGARVNFQPWGAPDSPFDPLWISPDTTDLAWNSESLVSEARSFDRLIVRGAGHAEWRLPGPVDPRSMLEAEWRIGGVPLPAPVWSSDSVVKAIWTERLAPPPDVSSGLGVSVRLGPVRACSRGSTPLYLTGRWSPVPSVGDIRVVGMLADPLPDDPFRRSEFIRLFNASDKTVDAGGWRWGEARLTRRWLMHPGETHQFAATDFENWPGLANAGGAMQITSAGGQPLTAMSWSPCSHSLEEFDGRGVPLARGPARGSDWHTEGRFSADGVPHIVGYGCPRDGSGQVRSLEVYLSVPACFIGETEWSWVVANDNEVPMVDELVPDAPSAVRLSRLNGEPIASDWPSRTTLVGRISPEDGGPEGRRMDSWTVEVTCPPAPLPDAVELRVEEALWASEDGGGEFVEVENQSGFPVDLSGLQATNEPHPDPADWNSWVEGGRSLILDAGAVVAFGQCSRWFRSGHPQAGPACWPVEAWSALPDEGGSLSIRLPSQGPDPVDSVSWHAGMRGPWWWNEKGWSWRRVGSGPQAWTPSSDGGSPGRINRLEKADCVGHEVPISVVTGRDGLTALRWRFPSAGHGAILRMIRWPEGTIVNSQSFEFAEQQQGEWTWGGLDSSGVPVPPGVLIWDVRWWGRMCRGRWRKRVRIPGHK